MRYGSVCSGIEAATVAWHPLGWQPQWFSEIEKFPSRVLAHHYPNVPNLGDMTKIHETKEFNERSIDLLVGGTPCQSFSVAGLRKGLADPRGNLALHFLSLADKARPKWVVWENVPGVLSSNSGRDFGTFLGGLGELGYGWAYRVLDAQYFGVAQRRRRVFFVGYLGDWRRAAAVLFERESMSGNPAPRREKREGTTGEVENGSSVGGWPAEVAPTLNASFGDKQGLEDQHALNGAGMFVVHGTQDPCVSDIAFAMGRNNGGENCVFDPNQITSPANRSNPVPELCHTLPATANSPIAFGINESPDVAHCLRSGASKADKHESTTYVAGSSIRRLTPRECERLQGFPDDYTAIPKAADGPRYKALGNSMAVPVMRWIGERINQVNQ